MKRSGFDLIEKSSIAPIFCLYLKVVRFFPDFGNQFGHRKHN